METSTHPSWTLHQKRFASGGLRSTSRPCMMLLVNEDHYMNGEYSDEA
jgi:hypothetical protein